MIETKIYDHVHRPSNAEKQRIVDFLFDNLQEYGDPKKDISMAIAYALKEVESFGGFVMVLMDGDRTKGATVINHTGMGGFIPENILVYIATHQAHRGEGLGKLLLEQAIAHAKGDIALHVEANNPAKRLYERFGFTNPYLEMRLKR